MRIVAVGGILLLSLRCCSLVSAEESDGTARVSVNIAGYKTKHDVMEHAFIDKDARDIQNAMRAPRTVAGFAEALKIYNDGKNSRTTTKARTIAEFWPGAHTNSVGLTSLKQPLWKMFQDYQTLTGFDPHLGAVAAMKGENSGTQGDYAVNRVASHVDFREQVIKKNIEFQIVMVYALHELEIAIEAYVEAKGLEIAQRYVDVWWAFYAGSMETGNGVFGYGPYALAERRSKFFGTGTAVIGNGGVSKVNDILLKATVEISRLMSTQGNAPAMNNIMKCVRAQLKIPLIQGCVMYGTKLL